MEMQNIEPVGALSKALSGPEQQSEPGPDPLAAILARLDALEAALEAAPLPVESVPTSEIREIAGNIYQVNRGAFGTSIFHNPRDVGGVAQPGVMIGAPAQGRTEADIAAIIAAHATPTEAIQRPKRTPAHERAIRRAWRERCERIARADLDRRALLRVNADNRLLLERLHEVEAADRASARIAGEALAEIAQLKASRRRTVKLALAQRKRRQQAEFAAEARAAETVAVSRELDAARWEIERIGAKRRRNALFARKRTREMVAAVNHMHDRLEAATQRAGVAEAALERLRADLADPSQPERPSDLVQLVRERDEARTANAALQDRCRRVEAARDQLAEAVEGMAGRLARAEAAVRRLELAA